jgi:hypothetical protein
VEHTVRVTSSPSGWTNNDIGFTWLEQVFNRYTKEKARHLYRLLILNGYGSCITMDSIEYYNQNKILLATFPPHSTHTLQPLGVCMLKPLSQAYFDKLSAFLKRSQGLLPIKKGDFFPLFWKTWVELFKEITITKCGGLRRCIGSSTCYNAPRPQHQGTKWIQVDHIIRV